MNLSHRIVGLFALWVVSIAPPSVVARPDGQKHWAYLPVQRPALPESADADWSRNPIDRFIRAKLEAAGIEPAAPADRRTLIRRLYLDLIGLPPTPHEVQRFLDDTSAGAVVKVVDDLLARPQYGERWARHWLDVVRYADTNGYERDGAKPNAWRYRDYVIDAFNHDKPYDSFLTEQLAGDEIEGSDASSQIATTFMRLGTFDDEPADIKVDRYDQLDDVLGTAATAFLGVTLRCARCHDHKYEPFSQVDYYRMLAVFEPLKRPQLVRADLDRPVGTQSELAAYQRGLAQSEAEIAAVWSRIEALAKPEIARLFSAPDKPEKGKRPSKRTMLPADAIHAFGTEAPKRSPGQQELVRVYSAKLEEEIRSIAPPEVAAALKPLEQRIAAIRAAHHQELPRAYIWYEEGPNAPETRVLKGGGPSRPAGKPVEPGVPAILAPRQPDAPRPTARSSGRRLWLARWLTAKDNPLSARVIVNRIWQFHFGEGLCPSSNDLGVMGEPPSHPELLDWLAAEFVASGWRLKPLHRLIVRSKTYQQASANENGAAKADPEDTLLSRWRARRLEAETIRDSILAVSGRLNARMAGPGIYPTLPRAVLEGQSMPGDGWGKSDEREQSRRSIYIFAKRSLAVPELELLDTPDTTGSCERRVVSTTGPQALTFLNGAFIHEQAQHVAARLVRLAGDGPRDQVEMAFALALGRPPRPEEIAAALEFLERQTIQIEADSEKLKPGTPQSRNGPCDSRRKALEAFCLVIMNMNEFVCSN
jgi:Protein of unknown function (DUF1553)/Protein of unknown function (DUF1549)